MLSIPGKIIAYHCVDCDEQSQDQGLCPKCGGYKLPSIQLEGFGVYLGIPREYPKERPQTSGRYLAWTGCEKYKAGGYYVIAWYENDVLGFGRWDKTITHWLPMPPAIREGE
jgi:hypothetical protein